MVTFSESTFGRNPSTVIRNTTTKSIPVPGKSQISGNKNVTAVNSRIVLRILRCSLEFSAWSLAYVLVFFTCEVLHIVTSTSYFLSQGFSCAFRKFISVWGNTAPGSSTSRPLFYRMQYPGYFNSQQVSGNVRHAEQVLDRVKRGIRLKMDKVLDAYLTGGDSDFPSCDSPVWIFGRSYSVNYDIEELRRSVSSCMWITYRKNFPSIGGTNITSDKGWGCMIRAGQMLVAKALLLRHLSADWHWDPDCRDHSYLKIVALFEDTKVAPLSLHQIAQSGSSLGKPIGSWLGPNTVAQALKKIISSDYLSVDLNIFIAMDSTLVKSEVKQSSLTSGHCEPASVPPTYIVSTPRPDSRWRPLLLVVPLRLGLSDLNEAYVPGIKATFEIPQNIGIIGGRPNHALYFIGYAANEVMYLDPHTVQPAMFVNGKVTDGERAADETYHIQKPGRMSFSSMDPSIAVCFFCKRESDFDTVCTKLTERFQVTPLPLFEICERRPHDWTTAPEVTTTSIKASKSSKKSTSKSLTSSFTSISLGASSLGASSKFSSSGHPIPRSAGGSPSSSLSGRSKSDIDDEDFEILG